MQFSMYFRPSHDTRSFSLHRCDGYPPTVCSFDFGASLTSHIEVSIPVSKEAQLCLMDTAPAARILCHVLLPSNGKSGIVSSEM